MASIWSKIFPCSNLTSDFAMLLLGEPHLSLKSVMVSSFRKLSSHPGTAPVDEPICNLSELINSSN